MSKLQELISRLCPNGVRYRQLISVANILYGYPFNSKLFCEDDSFIPLIRIRDVKPAKAATYYSGEYSDNYIIRRGDILVGMDGNFNLEKWNDRDGLLNQRVCKIYSKDETIVLNGFLYHLLGPIFKSIEDELLSGTVIHLSAARINRIEIPLPPLPVQEEIVRILDLFTDYTAELQAELQARKEQYEYYRNLLLTFNPSAYGCGTDVEQEINGNAIGGKFTPPRLLTNVNVIWKSLSELISINTGEQFNKRDMNLKGSYPVINGGILPSGFIEKYNCEENTITISQGGASAGFVAWQTKPFWAGAHCYVIKITSNDLNNKFLFFYLKNNEKYLQQMQHGAGIPALNRDKIKNLSIPIPPLEVQEKIVGILDRFEALVNDLSKGLPAEIAAVQERYEFFRNRLLTFNPLPA